MAHRREPLAIPPKSDGADVRGRLREAMLGPGTPPAPTLDPARRDRGGGKDKTAPEQRSSAAVRRYSGKKW
jgi:hypothetical protein